MRAFLVGLLILVTGCASASSIPETTDSAIEMAAKQSARSARYYSEQLQPHFFEHVVSQCIGNTSEDAPPFLFIIALDKSGNALRTYAKPETEHSKCLAQVARASSFPPPPFAPLLVELNLRHRR